MAGTGTRIEQGWTGTGIVGAADLAANVCVKFIANLLVVCAGSDKPIGTVQEPFKVGVAGTFYRAMKGTGAWVVTSGTVAVDDYVKTGAAGALVADGTSGATALSVNTVGQVREVGTNLAFVLFL
jgi:hypothetical protein